MFSGCETVAMYDRVPPGSGVHNEMDRMHFIRA